MDRYSVTIMPENITIEALKGESLLKAVRDAGIAVESPCGGQGTCGKCAVRVLEGCVETGAESHIPKSLRDEGYIPACSSVISADVKVEIPSFSRLARHQVLLSGKNSRNGFKYGYKRPLDPICKKLSIKLKRPDLSDSMNDLDRLKLALLAETGMTEARIGLPVLKKLPKALRDGNYEITAYIVDVDGNPEIVHVTPGISDTPAYGLAVDIGTTTVAVELLDATSGRSIGRAGAYNLQSAYGSDVISRIVFSDENPDGLRLLQEAAAGTINRLIGELLQRTGIARDELICMVFAGNTVMTHFFMGVPATWLRLEPYVPAFTSFPGVKARDVGIGINPEAYVFAMPSVASYVGGDISSGALAIGIDGAEKLTLFIDIGTNGEMVLGGRDWLVTCACSAGPAFEGSGITCGMRAMDGAIDRVDIDHESWTVSFSTVGDALPVGICGSGLIYALSEMKEAGIIDRAGKMREKPGSGIVRHGPDGVELLLVDGTKSGSGNDIVITEADVKNLLRAKGAVFAGIRTMLGLVQLDVEAIEKVYVAGGFGNYINIGDAIKIGMLPDLPLERFEYVGNSSLQGAATALLCRKAYREAAELAGKMTYLELSAGNAFMEEFVSATFIPHTDLGLFPSADI